MFLNSSIGKKHIWKWIYCACLIFMPIIADAASLDDIIKRKKLIVGIWLDPAEVNADGSPVPISPTVNMEIDLAKDLAHGLGVDLELVKLNLQDREPTLNKGKVDLLIASMSDTELRRQKMSHVLPSYYETGVNVITRRNEKKIRSWSDLHNRRICSQYGAFYNRIMSNNYGVDVVPLHHNNLAIEALLDGRCIAIVYEEATIQAMLQDKQWKDYHMPLTTLHNTPWSVFLENSEKGGKLEAYISKEIIRWHRTGFIQSLEKKWGLIPSPYLEKMHKVWNKKVDGRYFCPDKIDDKTPAECLGQ